MADEVLRNGVPHQVTTSLVTHNAVLPQNIFIKDESAPLRDSERDDVAPALATRDSSSGFQQTPSQPAPQAAPNYPVSQDKLAAHEALSTIKSHIRDNIQALKNLARSDNRQRIAADALNKNIQSLGPSRSIEENKLYREKKSIKSNRQLISKTATERPAPSLATPNTTSPRSINSGRLESQATDFQNADQGLKDKDRSDQDNAFQMRVKKLKRQVRNVDSTLQNLDPEA